MGLVEFSWGMDSAKEAEKYPLRRPRKPSLGISASLLFPLHLLSHPPSFPATAPGLIGCLGLLQKQSCFHLEALACPVPAVSVPK